ncbi:MAG: hypothetical protein AAFR23_10150 [Pseudomonadota bacterium]
MPDFGLDPEDLAVGSAIRADRKKRGRNQDDEDAGYDDDERRASGKSLAMTILFVVGTLVLLLALVLTVGA